MKATVTPIVTRRDHLADQIATTPIAHAAMSTKYATTVPFEKRPVWAAASSSRTGAASITVMATTERLIG
ncbi:hypothetical protein [Sphingomonas sp. Leaf231]|uniref:hypothetical protein n=1 Tax=Sphingomonas sp. Leaf231 TaxID=1736301 RepID=UPI000A43CF80|nr:hypothetical protein [Sphingomonas sp. Leaf231]